MASPSPPALTTLWPTHEATPTSSMLSAQLPPSGRLGPNALPWRLQSVLSFVAVQTGVAARAHVAHPMWASRMSRQGQVV